MEKFTLANGGVVHVSFKLVESVVAGGVDRQGVKHVIIAMVSGAQHIVVGEVDGIAGQISKALSRY